MIINILSLGATTADDLNNPIVISDADKLKLRSRVVGTGMTSPNKIPSLLSNVVCFADTNWTSGTWTVSVKFQGANGELEVCTTTSGEIGSDELTFLTPTASFLQSASSEQGLFPLEGPNGELPQVDVTEATAGALVTLNLYIIIPDY